MQKIITKRNVLTISGIFAALFVANTVEAAQTFQNLVDTVILPAIQSLIGVLVGIALLVFIWGLIKFIAKAGNEDARTEGKQVMAWGIVAFFVLASLWGIIEFIQGSLGIDKGIRIQR